MEEERRLNGYRIDEELSDSPICKVIRGYDEKLDRTVILKKLHPQMAREEDIRERFEREAKVCAQVKHENIVDIYGYENEPELSMLVLEYVDGPTLDDTIQLHGALHWHAAAAILFAILRGLAHAHNKGVLHRDIKPANILISRTGIVKITDFGLASLEGASKLTQQSGIIGTPAYMSPEQINGADLDRRSDLFAVGATIYEVLTGISPFRGESFSETMNKVLNSELRPPSNTVPDIPPEIDQIVLRLLEKQPTKRYASADDALEDLNRFVARKEVKIGKHTVAAVINADDVSDTPPDRPKTPPASSVIMPRRKTSQPAYTVIAILVGLIATLALIFSPSVTKNEHNATQLSEDLLHSVERSLAERTELDEQRADNPTPTLKPAITNPEPAVRGNSGESETETVEPTNQQQPDQSITGNGFLNVSAKPWANISIDNEYYGQTPVTNYIELPPGIYEVAFSNDQFPTSVVETVVLEPESELDLDIDLWDYFAVFRFATVKPWAEIFIDGDSYGETPLAKPVILPLGRHSVELRNPSFKTWTQTFNSTKGNNQHEIIATLEPKQP